METFQAEAEDALLRQWSADGSDEDANSAAAAAGAHTDGDGQEGPPSDEANRNSRSGDEKKTKTAVVGEEERAPREDGRVAFYRRSNNKADCGSAGGLEPGSP